jgi:hypothetical protein
VRTCYDSTSANAIPTSALLVAGYVDGIYKWSLADWGRFPNAVHVPIACFASTNAGTVLDVETGCSIPAEAPGWALKRRAAGVDPTVYVNWSNWNLTRAAFIQQGVAEPHWWLASYDGKAEIPAGTVAKQYANTAMSGGHYDLSAVADYWPGVDRPGGTAGSEIPVGGDMFEDHDRAINEDNHAALSRIEAALGTVGGGPNYLGWSRDVSNTLADIKATLAKIPTLPAGAAVDLTPLNTKMDRLQATLDKVFK